MEGEEDNFYAIGEMLAIVTQLGETLAIVSQLASLIYLIRFFGIDYVQNFITTSKTNDGEGSTIWDEDFDKVRKEEVEEPMSPIPYLQLIYNEEMGVDVVKPYQSPPPQVQQQPKGGWSDINIIVG